jgi:hypothetical protein
MPSEGYEMSNAEPTPSMDDKSIPSPPARSHEQYLADKEAGVQPVGKPKDKNG